GFGDEKRLFHFRACHHHQSACASPPSAACSRGGTLAEREQGTQRLQRPTQGDGRSSACRIDQRRLPGADELSGHQDSSRSHHGMHVCRSDRKSTRLNSSHVKISYAVFCLKKKRRTSVRLRSSL